MSEVTHVPVLIGRRKDGRPIHLVQGGAEPAPDADPAVDPAQPDDPPAAEPPERKADPGDGDATPPPELGDPGKQALERMKSRVKDETTRRKAAEAEIAELKSKMPAPEDTPSPEQVRAELRRQMQIEMAKERALDRVEVLAAKNFADPADARVFLASQVDDFVDDATIDSDAIAEALADLLKARPYLAAGTPRRWTATGDGGARGGKPKDLDSQIAEAQARGDVTSFIRLQTQKLQSTTT
jgi:hypothetical protein